MTKNIQNEISFQFPTHLTEKQEEIVTAAADFAIAHVNEDQPLDRVTAEACTFGAFSGFVAGQLDALRTCIRALNTVDRGHLEAALTDDEAAKAILADMTLALEN